MLIMTTCQSVEGLGTCFLTLDFRCLQVVRFEVVEETCFLYSAVLLSRAPLTRSVDPPRLFLVEFPTQNVHFCKERVHLSKALPVVGVLVSCASCSLR